MQVGTGLSGFREEFRSRFFDVGISEEHAVTFAGGLAARGMVPVFAVYSTFLQRALRPADPRCGVAKHQSDPGHRPGWRGGGGRENSIRACLMPLICRRSPKPPCIPPRTLRNWTLQLSYLVKEGQGLCAIRYPRGKELFKPAGFQAAISSFQCIRLDGRFSVFCDLRKGVFLCR